MFANLVEAFDTHGERDNEITIRKQSCIEVTEIKLHSTTPFETSKGYSYPQSKPFTRECEVGHPLKYQALKEYCAERVCSRIKDF